jgi:hypothetical protein
MTKPVANPTRLSRLPEGDDALGAGRMFRAAGEIHDEDLPRLRWRLRTSLRLRTQRPRLVLRAALVVGVVFCTGGLVGAVVTPFLARKQPVAVTPAPGVPPSPTHRKARPGLLPATPQPAEALPVAPEPEPETLKPIVAPAKPRPVRVAVLSEPVPPPPPVEVAPAEPPPVAPPSPIAVEQSLLGQAMKRLRDGHDAKAALALLEQHSERFPEGALAAEASVLRTEALLALGRREEALAVLDGAPLASLPNRDEQLVVRGELRAAHRRWREASQDFDGALRGHDLPAMGARARSLQERALWGRAAARSRLGDQDGARADLELYLRHFPAGSFAGPAASLLKGQP